MQYTQTDMHTLERLAWANNDRATLEALAIAEESLGRRHEQELEDSWTDGYEEGRKFELGESNQRVADLLGRLIDQCNELPVPAHYVRTCEVAAFECAMRAVIRLLESELEEIGDER